MSTTAIDAGLLIFAGLPPEEQDELLERMMEARALREAAGESQTGRCVRSLRLVAEHLGHVPGVEEYKRGAAELIAAGEDVETFTRLYRHFENNWARAREALALAETTSQRRIDARFRGRRLGKVWRFSEPALREALHEATARYERPPSVAEFESWREHQLELAQARGDLDFQLPSSSPYRRRYGTWEAGLLHFGYTPAEVELRLDNRAEFRPFDPDADLPNGLPLAELAPLHSVDLALTTDQVARLRRGWETLPRRSRYVLTVRLGLGVEAQTLEQAAEPLGLSMSRVSQIQGLSVRALAANAAGDRRDRPDPTSLHDAVVGALQGLARLAPTPRP